MSGLAALTYLGKLLILRNKIRDAKSLAFSGFSVYLIDYVFTDLYVENCL